MYNASIQKEVPDFQFVMLDETVDYALLLCLEERRAWLLLKGETIPDAG